MGQSNGLSRIFSTQNNGGRWIPNTDGGEEMDDYCFQQGVVLVLASTEEELTLIQLYLFAHVKLYQ